MTINEHLPSADSDLVLRISNHAGLRFFGSEVGYLGIHLLGNGAIESGSSFSDLPFLINEKSSRNCGDSVILHHLLRGNDDGVGDVHGLDEVADDLRISFIDTYSDQLKPTFSIGLIELNEVGDGFAAGSTPGRPEVEENDFPFEPGESDLLIIKGFKGKIRGQSGGGFLLLSTMGEKEEANDA